MWNDKDLPEWAYPLKKLLHELLSESERKEGSSDNTKKEAEAYAERIAPTTRWVVCYHSPGVEEGRSGGRRIC